MTGMRVMKGRVVGNTVVEAARPEGLEVEACFARLPRYGAPR